MQNGGHSELRHSRWRDFGPYRASRHAAFTSLKCPSTHVSSSDIFRETTHLDMRVQIRDLAFFVLFSVAYAMPSSVPELDSIPRNAVKIAHDRDLDVLIAYDAGGRIIGQLSTPSSDLRMTKHDAGPCVTMSPSDIQKCK